MSEEETAPALRPVTEKKFVQAMTVRMDDGAKLSVPTTLEANRARNQIIAARTTELFTKQLAELMKPGTDGVQLKPKELVDIISAAKKLQELNDASFGIGAAPTGDGDALTGLGKLVAGAVEAGANAANAAKDGANLVDEMRKLNELGKRSDVIDIEESK